MPDYIYMEIDFDCSLYFVQEHQGHDGQIRRACYVVNRGKGFNYVEQDNFKFNYGGILIPCDRSVTAAIKDFLEIQRMLLPIEQQDNHQRGPYYFTQDMSRDPCFERAEQTVALLGGPQTAYANVFADEEPMQRNWLLSHLFGEHSREVSAGENKNPQNFTMARYNCWTATQGITQYVGGIDLAALDPALATVYRAMKANGVMTNLRETALKNKVPGLTGREFGIDDYLIERVGTPPFIIVHGANSFAQLMSARAFRDNPQTVSEYMAQQPVFTRSQPARAVTTPQPA
jgi:hypothetical protein